MSNVTRRDVTLVVVTVLVVAAAAMSIQFLTRTTESGTSTVAGHSAPAQRYHCPMHPTMVSDKPGDCPICGMRLVPIVDEVAKAPTRPMKKTIYRSTMNPGEVSDKPGKDSMGMDMVPVEIDEPPVIAGASVAGRVAVKVAAERQQLIGVRTALVERKPLARTITAVGLVTYDETRLHHVHTKVSGWIEHLYTNSTWQFVRKGQPLLTIYSPELLASAQEYLLAVRARERLAGTTLPSIRGSGEELVESAKRRLQLFDISADQMRALEETGQAPRTMTLHAPVTGHIIMRNVQQGEKIEPSTNILDIADLSRVWVLADIYEYELPFVQEGQTARMTLSYLPGLPFEGRITLVYPVLSESTRTVKVRLEFPNPNLALKPEMYGEVEIQSNIGERLVVPDSAVISSGTRDIAFVDHGDGYFEPREVKLGIRLPESAEVLDGLAAGERVVVSGNFLIDSESKLKAALSTAGTGKTGSADKKAAPDHVH